MNPPWHKRRGPTRGRSRSRSTHRRCTAPMDGRPSRGRPGCPVDPAPAARSSPSHVGNIPWEYSHLPRDPRTGCWFLMVLSAAIATASCSSVVSPWRGVHRPSPTGPPRSPPDASRSRHSRCSPARTRGPCRSTRRSRGPPCLGTSDSEPSRRCRTPAAPSWPLPLPVSCAPPAPKVQRRSS